MLCDHKGHKREECITEGSLGTYFWRIALIHHPARLETRNSLGGLKHAIDLNIVILFSKIILLTIFQIDFFV